MGDAISEGDLLAEIETDKATMEFESFQEGLLLHIGVEESSTAPVDCILAILGEEGEDVKAIIEADASPASEELKEEILTPAPVQEAKVEVQEAAPILTSFVATKAIGGRTKASPLAKRLAEEKGLIFQKYRVLEKEGEQ